MSLSLYFKLCSRGPWYTSMFPFQPNDETLRYRPAMLSGCRALVTSPSSLSSDVVPKHIRHPNNGDSINKLVLYRGKGIKIFRVLVRLKIFQLSGVAALAIPLATFFSDGHVPMQQGVIATSLLIGSGTASTALAFFSRRYIGELSLITSPLQSAQPVVAYSSILHGPAPAVAKNMKIRLSTLDFWGNREDIDVDPRESIIPPFQGYHDQQIAQEASRPGIPLHVAYPASRQYILSLRYGAILNKPGLKALLRGDWDALQAIYDSHCLHPNS